MEKEMIGKIQASQFRRQATWSQNEHNLLLEDAKKNALSRFLKVIKKYEISDDDVDELVEISQFLV